jgi:membrane fusion protein, multidrug efflux system
LTRKTVLKLLLAALGLLLAYWASTYIAAYTDDAYLTTDIIRVAPRVPGHVQSVEVADNQRVAKGQTLAVIDPTPFRLRVKNAQAQLAQASSQLSLQNSALESAKAKLDEAASARGLAATTAKRYKDLIQSKAIAQQAYDEIEAALKEAMDRSQAAQAEVNEAAKAVEAHAMDVAAAKAELDLAQYEANHTVLYAPVDGFVTALNIKPGDYAKVGDPLMAVVSDVDWRILANYREQFVRHIQPGQKVIVHLDNYPWRLFAGVVQGVAHGVSRDPAPGKLLPYVEPTTNWIRLSRRFPVRIHLTDRPPDLRLLSGSDARTVVIY